MANAYLNGEFLPIEECKISVLDRGFIFGDAIYELIPVYNSKPFYLSAHLKRLNRSLEQTKITNPHSEDQWINIIQQLIDKSGLQQLSVYIQISRGVAPRDHAFPVNVMPTVFAMTNPWPSVSEDMYTQGLSAVTVDDMRWDRCDIKVTSLLANVMKKQQAIEHGAHEAILVRDGKVLEGSATNVFIVKNEKVSTAPKDHLILPGITRDVVVELLSELNIPLTESAITQQELNNADEVWITSSTKECVPVTRVDDQAIGTGKPGELWARVFAAYQQRKN